MLPVPGYPALLIVALHRDDGDQVRLYDTEAGALVCVKCFAHFEINHLY
jgi:hypothetical protein